MLITNPISIFGLATTLLISLAATAEELPAQPPWSHAVEGISSETSDHAQMQSLLVRSQKNRFDLTYPYLGERPEQSSWGAQAVIDHRDVSGQSVNGQAFSLLGGRKFSHRLAVEGRAGLHRQTPLAKGSATVGEASLTVSGAPLSFLGWEIDRFFAQLQAESSAAYSQLALPVRDDHTLRVTTTKATLSFFPVTSIPVANRIRVTMRGLGSAFSDRNFRKQYGADAMFGVMTDPLWIWFGVGAERTHNSLATGHYWAPEVFTQWGLRGEASVPFTAFVPENFFGARALRPLTLAFGGSLSRIKEGGFELGSSNYSLSSLQWGGRDHPYLRMSYERIRSEQSGNEWRSDAWILTGQWIF